MNIVLVNIPIMSDHTLEHNGLYLFDMANRSKTGPPNLQAIKSNGFDGCVKT
jgi:hypothetical protein